MSRAVLNTPSAQAVRTVAEHALMSVEGLQIKFLASKYGDLKRAASAARSFQTSFSAMRARERGKQQVGRYDPLACCKLPLPNDGGFEIIIAKASGLLLDWDIIDIATGKPPEEFAPERGVIAQIMDAIATMRYQCKSNGVAFYDPLSAEQRADFYTLEPLLAVTMYADNGLVNPYQSKPDCPAPCFPYPVNLDPKLGYKTARLSTHNPDDTDTDSSPTQPQRASDLALLIPDDADPFTYGVDGNESQA